MRPNHLCAGNQSEPVAEIFEDLDISREEASRRHSVPQAGVSGLELSSSRSGRGGTGQRRGVVVVQHEPLRERPQAARALGGLGAAIEPGGVQYCTEYGGTV